MCSYLQIYPYFKSNCTSSPYGKRDYNEDFNYLCSTDNLTNLKVIFRNSKKEQALNALIFCVPYASFFDFTQID